MYKQAASRSRPFLLQRCQTGAISIQEGAQLLGGGLLEPGEAMGIGVKCDADGVVPEPLLDYFRMYSLGEEYSGVAVP
jgi:hypothetical protein